MTDPTTKIVQAHERLAESAGVLQDSAVQTGRESEKVREINRLEQKNGSPGRI